MSQQLGLQEGRDPLAVLLGRPAELDREHLVELGAREGAVALPCLGDGQAFPEVLPEVPADASGLVGESIVERRELLLSWLPNAEPFELPGATHFLHVQNPRGMAEALASFFARHPLRTAY